MKRILTYIATIGIATTMLISSAFAASNTATESNNQQFTPEQVKSIHKIIKDYLVSNPKVLLEVSMALRKQMAEEQQKQSQTAIQANKDQLFNNNNHPIAGNPAGTKVIAEFFDYQCPHCKDAKEVIDKLIKKNKDLKVVLIDWPIFGGASLTAAKAAIAANKQDKYLQMHEALLAEQNPLTKDKIMQIAKNIGLNIKQLKKDMDDQATMNQIKANFVLARKLGLAGTPAFILTNKDENKFKFVPGASTQQNLQNLLNELN